MCMALFRAIRFLANLFNVGTSQFSHTDDIDMNVHHPQSLSEQSAADQSDEPI